MLAFRKKQRAVENFDRDYPTFLIALSSSLRLGLDPVQALVEAQKLFARGSVMHREIEHFNAALEQNGSVMEAVQAFGGTLAHSDVELFRAVFRIAHLHGAGLSSALQRVAGVTRRRQAFRRRAAAAVAMQRLSAYGIVGCATLFAAAQGMASRAVLAEAVHHPVVGKLLLMSVLVMIGGLCWLRRICAIRL